VTRWLRAAGPLVVAGLALATLGCSARSRRDQGRPIVVTTERPEPLVTPPPESLSVPTPASAPTPTPAPARRREPAPPDPAAAVLPAEYPATLGTRRERLIERGLRLGAEDIGYYMDVQEARLRQASGTALRLSRRGSSVMLELPGRLAFEIGSARLAAGAIAALTDVAKVLVDYRLTIISVEGHTDDSGDAAQNRTLSGQRAAAVARLLVSNGVELERIVVVGYGSERPVAENTTEVGREANRRVVLRVDALQR